MKRYITIDGGTTNTRLTLMEDGKAKQTVKLAMGAQKSMDGNEALKEGIRTAIRTLLENNGLTEQDITRILASGMITSEFGLCCLPHLVAPVGLPELRAGMKEIALPELSEIPFVFIPGVRTDSERLEERDMMRGEETELMGLAESDTALQADCLYVLPGSHSKLIETDADGRITRFRTMLTGEMIAALSGHTILRDAVDLSCRETDQDSLERGYEYAKERGINEALFKTRILKNLFGATPTACYSFFLGAVLADELTAILESATQTVVLGGKPQLRDAMAALLQTRCQKRVLTVSDEAVALSTSRGMIRVYEAQNP